MAAVAEEEGSTVVVVDDTCYGSSFDVLGFVDGILGLAGLSKEVQRAAYLERAQRGDVCLRPMMRLDEGGNAPLSLLGFCLGVLRPGLLSLYLVRFSPWRR